MTLPTYTIERRGIINIPLFKPPYTPVNSVFSTVTLQRQNSLWPQLNGGAFFDNTGLFTEFRLSIPGISNQSIINLGPGGGNQLGQRFFGSFSWGYTEVGAQNGALVIPQPNQAGTYTAAGAFFSPDTTFTGAPNIGGDGADIGMNFFDPASGQLMPGYLTDDNPFGSAVLTAHVFDYPGRNWHKYDTAGLPYGYSGGLSTANYFQVPDILLPGLTYALLDTTNPGPTGVIRQRYSYFMEPFTGGPANAQALMNPVFDDPVLQAIWMGGAAYGIDVFAGGWIITFLTNGTGPTGQTYEIAVVDPGLFNYNLLRFVPTEATAVPALTRMGAGFGWQVKIDPQGILYFNSGNGADQSLLWYSYSPIPWPYPQFAYTPGSFNLPCYTPCYPS